MTWTLDTLNDTLAMLRERRSETFCDTEAVAQSGVQDLDRSLVDNFLAEARAYSPKLAQQPDDIVLKRKRVLDIATDQVTIAGLYALGEYPQQFFPSLKISGVLEDPSGQLRNADKLEADGSLPEMLSTALRWVRKNLSARVQPRPDGNLIDTPEVPLLAVREIIANALVHRDLNPLARHSKDVHIRITERNIVVSNPGGLWGVNRHDLQKPGHKSAVNDVLYELCKFAKTEDNARVIEGEGSGIYEAQQAVAAAGLKPIEFINTGVQFTALISREKSFQPEQVIQELQEENQRKIFQALSRTSSAQSVSELREATGLTERQVRYALAELEKQNLVDKRRRGGTSAYEYVPSRS